jgi:hypothetical protein
LFSPAEKRPIKVDYIFASAAKNNGGRRNKSALQPGRAENALMPDRSTCSPASLPRSERTAPNVQNSQADDKYAFDITRPHIQFDADLPGNQRQQKLVA